MGGRVYVGPCESFTATTVLVSMQYHIELLQNVTYLVLALNAVILWCYTTRGRRAFVGPCVVVTSFPMVQCESKARGSCFAVRRGGRYSRSAVRLPLLVPNILKKNITRLEFLQRIYLVGRQHTWRHDSASAFKHTASVLAW